MLSITAAVCARMSRSTVAVGADLRPGDRVVGPPAARARHERQPAGELDVRVAATRRRPSRARSSRRSSLPPILGANPCELPSEMAPRRAAAATPSAACWQADSPAHLGVRRRRERHQLVRATGTRPAAPAPDRARPASPAGTPATRPGRASRRSSSSAIAAIASVLSRRRCSNSGSAAAQSSAGLVEAAVELDDVLERAVGALAVERDDGVGGVAEQADPPGRVPRRSVHGAEQPDRVVLVVVDERRSERHEVRIVRPEVPLDRRRAAQRGEAARPAVGPEQRARERAVRVGQGDHHRRAARPDVQRARVEGELAVLRAGCAAPCSRSRGSRGARRGPRRRAADRAPPNLRRRRRSRRRRRRAPCRSGSRTSSRRVAGSRPTS